MINLYALLGVNKEAKPGAIEDACRTLHTSEPDLALEAHDVLLHEERSRTYQQIHTQFEALALAHQRLVEQDPATELQDKDAESNYTDNSSDNRPRRKPRIKSISKQFKDTNHWSRRLVEF